MAELVDWLHHESITRAATNTANSTIGQPFGNGIDVCPVCGKPSTVGKPQTNADRIRAMTDEELAKKMSGLESFALTCGGGWSPEKWLEWLKKDAD